LDFYKKRGHRVIPSVSLIPEDDPSLLFVNSGMFPLVPYLLGEKHPEGKRLVNFQRSFRAEDIEEIGNGRHTTFFEMLGNWSLGDYFKEEQLQWWFQFLIEVLGLDPKRIYQTVYLGDGLIEKDHESISILKKIYKKYGISAEEGPESEGDSGSNVEINFEKDKIFAYRDKNWWQRGDAVGELGGPDSETFYDTGKEHNPSFGKFCHLNCDCGRFLEIGNSVFMQYQKTENGWKEIKNKNVDFGGGLERITMVVGGLESVFETDLFKPIFSKIKEFSGKEYRNNPRGFEVIADHIKAAVFIIGDAKGVGPSNKGQGYFARRLIRRSIRYGRLMEIDAENWMNALSEEVIKTYKEIYPELEKNSRFVSAEMEKETGVFQKTLERGLKKFAEIKDKKIISGKVAADLYQTYGFPLEMIEEMAGEEGGRVDKRGFLEEIEKHKEMSRTASAGVFKGGLADSGEKTTKLHTATHLLLAALRDVLGKDVFQKGSNITSERLRFDFSFPRKITEEEIKRVEEIINDKIKENLKISKEEMTVEKALKSGALASFEEKYPDRVIVYTIKSKKVFSKEICRGPHIRNTSEIGRFKIVKEEASSAGTRRIKAIIDDCKKGESNI